MKKRILIVEDDEALAKGLELNVALEGYEPLVAGSAEDARALLTRSGADLILLDVGLPGEDGFSLCRNLRRQSLRVPILFLTARDEEADRVRGLAEGGDDYVVKPFHLAELLARVRGSFRRQGWEREARKPHPRVVEIGSSRVDFERRAVTTPRGAFTLSEREAAILALLVESDGAPVSRRTILDRIWGLATFPTTRTVDNFVLRLRRLLEPDPTRPVHILTVHRVGYRLDAGDVTTP